MITFNPYVKVIEETPYRMVIRRYSGVRDFLANLALMALILGFTYGRPGGPSYRGDVFWVIYVPLFLTLSLVPLDYIFDAASGRITVKRGWTPLLAFSPPLYGAQRVEISSPFGFKRAFIVYEGGRRQIIFKGIFGLQRLEFCVDAANRFIAQLNGHPQLPDNQISPYPRPAPSRSTNNWR